jgi:galactokinase
VLIEEGHELTGWNGVIAGNIPIGAGLSSSAALENASAKAFFLTSEIEKLPTELATIGRKAENDWVGVNVGIMDQLISAIGKQGHASLIDCRSLDYEHVKIPKEITLVVLDTMTRRELISSNYNRRREEIERAAEILQVKNLRDATLTILEKNKKKFGPVIYKRARHVISENKRVLDFHEAMLAGDVHGMGNLVNESHTSLRDDYEVSSQELNVMVEISQKYPSCLGVRMTGAGFGGCALALIDSSATDEFIKYAFSAYLTETGIEPNIFRVESADGVQVIKQRAS